MGTDHQVKKRIARAVDRGLVLGNMGPGTGWIKIMATRLEAALQDAVRESGGELDVATLATIQTACRWERFALWAQREVRRRGERFGPDTMLAYMRSVPWASGQRDACIRRLKLDRDAAESIFDALYRELPEDQPGPGGNGAEASSERVSGDPGQGDSSSVPATGTREASPGGVTRGDPGGGGTEA